MNSEGKFSMTTKALDPLHLSERIYKQFSRLLDMMEDPANSEEMTIPQLIAGLKTLQSYDCATIRKYQEETDVGSAAREAAKAFQSNATGRGAKPKRAGRPSLAAVVTEDDDSAA
jgi:hypothetical protein